MRLTWGSISLIGAALLAACAAGPTPPRGGTTQAAAPATSSATNFLPGLWEAEISGNHYQMRVAWNQSTRQYEGALAAQGAGSKYAGFTIGEIVWRATPTANPNQLHERQMARDVGIFGPTGSFKWLEGTVDLRRSSSNELVTSFARFRRVGN
jgi:hypothetical protein